MDEGLEGERDCSAGMDKNTCKRRRIRGRNMEESQSNSLGVSTAHRTPPLRYLH
jgi:hypothetical protein